MHLDQLTQEDLYSMLPTTGESVTKIIGQQGDIQLSEPFKKAQIVRLVDVFVLGPAMLWAGLGKQVPEGLKAVLFLTGAGTILYNGYNYLQNEKFLEQ